MKRVFKTCAVVLSCIGWIVVLLIAIASTRYSIVTVVSGSMVPAINVGESAVVEKVLASECNVGDIIVYRGSIGDIIHRVVYKDTRMNLDNVLVTTLRTQGDANNFIDEHRITDDDNIRRVTSLSIEKVSNFARIAKSPITMILCGILLSVGPIVVFKGKHTVEVSAVEIEREEKEENADS